MNYLNNPIYYDKAMICENGHLITSSLSIDSRQNQKFCDTCGSSCVTSCKNCNEPIKGSLNQANVVYLDYIYPIPNYCNFCGEKFPWLKKKIEAIEKLIELAPEIDIKDRKMVLEYLPDLSINTPRTELAIITIKKILNKSKKYGKIILEKIITEVAADSIKELIMRVIN